MRLTGVNQPLELVGARGKTIEFTHLLSPAALMIYFTDGTYVIVWGKNMAYEYIVEEMGS